MKKETLRTVGKMDSFYIHHPLSRPSNPVWSETPSPLDKERELSI